MNIDYSQFLNMIPEVTLTVILLIVFVVDLLTAQKASPLAIHQAENGELALAKEQVPAGVKAQGEFRKWFNPFVCVLMLIHVLINIFPTAAAESFGGRYVTNVSIGFI